MKQYILTICYGAIIISFSCCIKQRAAEETGGSLVIIGTWELKHAQNGMSPEINYPSGNGNMLKFADSTYERFTNNTLVKSGHYIIIKDSSVVQEVGLNIPFGQFTNRIIFDNEFSTRKTFIHVLNDTLTLLSGFFPLDAGSRMSYQKKIATFSIVSSKV